jgi:nitrogen fixation protein FixH
MADFKEAGSVDHAHQELLDAGLTHEELTRQYVANVVFGECTATLRRRKGCWSVRVSNGLPYEAARKLNQEWGKRIRVRGAGWSAPLKEGEAVLLWEVDDPEALRVLIRALKDHFLPPAAGS